MLLADVLELEDNFEDVVEVCAVKCNLYTAAKASIKSDGLHSCVTEGTIDPNC